jgi:hypothetical protein
MDSRDKESAAARWADSCHSAVMHIVRKTNQELVVVDGSIWISVFLLCAAAFMGFQGVAKKTPNWWILVALLALFAFIAWRRETVTFDAARQEVQWVRRRAFSLAGGTVAFSEIKGIALDSMTDNHGVLTYRLTILTAGKPVPMSDGYGGGEGHYESLRKQILEFLGMDKDAQSSAEPGDEASIRSLLMQGRKVDAITAMRARYQLGLAEAVDRVNEIDQKMKAAQ